MRTDWTGMHMKQGGIVGSGLAMMAALVLAPDAAAAQRDAGPLTLAQVFQAVQAHSPRIAAASALAEARQAVQAAAALPPDPTFRLGVMNFSVPGLETDMPTSMAPAVEAMQMVPFPGKLSIAGRIAGHSTDIARAEAVEVWWTVRAEAADAFFTLYETDRRIAVARETLGLLRDFAQVATAMYGAGEGRQSDVLRAGVEVARMEADLATMMAMRAGEAARLNALMNRPADATVGALEYGEQPSAVPEAATLRAWADESRPMLAGGRTAVEQAESRGALARRDIWPDPVVGVSYGQRAGGMDGATERMGSVMLGFSVPIFAKQRQLRMRDEAAAMERMARADLAAMRAGVDARIGELVAGLDRARTLVRLYRADVLPQARATVESSFSSYRAGTVDFMTLLDAQMSFNEYEQELHALLAEYGRGVAELEMTVGRVLPRSGPVVAEAR